jgi:CheY-like chemotaxis protein
MESCEQSRILIVDDESGIRTLFRKILELDLPDCQIDLAANGAEGVEAFCSSHPKVIMMDLSMPVMNGEVAFQEIMKVCAEKDWEEPSVVFCTGFAPPNTVQEVVEQSAKHCLLSKPVGREVIVESVKSRL